MPENNVDMIEVGAVAVQHLAENEPFNWQEAIVQAPLVEPAEDIAWAVVEEDDWDAMPKQIVKEVIEPDPEDAFHVEVTMWDNGGENSFIEIQQVENDNLWVDATVTVGYAEAIRLHRALGKVLENGQENV